MGRIFEFQYARISTVRQKNKPHQTHKFWKGFGYTKLISKNQTHLSFVPYWRFQQAAHTLLLRGPQSVVNPSQSVGSDGIFRA